MSYYNFFASIIETKEADKGIFVNFQKFKHIMRELQGAIIIGSAFQALLGYTGLMSLLVRYDFFHFSSQQDLLLWTEGMSVTKVEKMK